MQLARLFPSSVRLDIIALASRSTEHCARHRARYRHSISTLSDRPRTSAAMASGNPGTAAAPLKKRSVVSSFIIKYPEPGQEGAPRVALFRRSDKVSTYQ